MRSQTLRFPLPSVLTLLLGLNFFSAMASAQAVNAENRDQSLQAFQYIYNAVKSPRCMNCHPAGDRPTQYDGMTVHKMNVQRRIGELGMACSTCHQLTNGNEAHTPPGAPHWGLPDAVKAWGPQSTPSDICEMWLDPQRNYFESGDRKGEPRSLEDLQEHLTHDALVKWGWNPGPGRTPIAGTHEQFAEQVRIWIATGAFCPDAE